MINGDTIVLTGQDQVTYHGFLYRLGKLVLRFRWYLIIGLGVFVTLFEGFEFLEGPDASAFSDPHVRVELLIYMGIIILVALLAEIYVRLLRMHSHALKILKLKHALSRDLTRSEDWNDVCEHICQKLGEYGPFDEVLLFAYENDSAAYQAAASWKAGVLESNLAHDLSQMLTDDCVHQDVDHSACTPTIHELDLAGAYCLPIYDLHTPVARLYLRLSPGGKLTKEISDLLENAEDEIAIALTTARLRQEHDEMMVAKATGELRSIISQDLHDTIGQNLCYIRMKLDQFSQPDISDDLASLKPELEFMRDLSNDSYELVRGLLVAMSSEPSSSLENLLEYHARLVSDRTGIRIMIFYHGQPCDLDPTLVHHIYFIFREALTNIEKHSGAQIVTINVNWDKEELQIEISDNGIGFDPSIQPDLGHYGLTIMGERARALGGRLDLLSSAEDGTHVSLWLPLAV